MVLQNTLANGIGMLDKKTESQNLPKSTTDIVTQPLISTNSMPARHSFSLKSEEKPFFFKKQSSLKSDQTLNPNPETAEDFKMNERILARNLQRDKPKGIEGFKFVLHGILKAQDNGIIQRNEKNAVNKASKLAKLMRTNINLKLSKQQKDAELIKVIKKNRKQIIDRLMQYSVLGSEDKMDERIEAIFTQMMVK